MSTPLLDLKMKNRTELLLCIYIMLYIGIPANGIDEILGVNLHILVLLGALLSYFADNKIVNKLNGLTQKYVGIQLFFLFAFLLSSTLFNEVNYYGVLMNFFQFSIVMFLMGQVINQDNYQKFLQFFVYGCLLNSVIVHGGPYLGIQTIKYNGINEDRITIIGRDNNELSLIHNMSVVIALYFIRNKQRVILNVVSIGLTLVTILATGSRTGLITCFAMIGVNFILSAKSIKQRLYTIVGSLVLGFSVIYYSTHYMSDTLLERYLNIGEELEEGTMANRRIIWDYIIKAFNQSNTFEQIIGHGWNTTPLFTFNGYDAHNVFLKMALEFGIIGVVVIVLYLFFFFKQAFVRKSEPTGFLIGGVILCVTISFMTLSWIYNIIIWMVFLLMHKVIVYTKQ